MTGKIDDVASGMLRHSRSAFTVAFCFAGITGCRVLPASQPVRTEIWYVASSVMPGAQKPVHDSLASTGGIVLLDTASLRPVRWSRGAGISTFTTYRGSRYHPESIRAIAEDSAVLARFADSIAIATPSGAGLFLDLQQATAADLALLVTFARAVSRASQVHHASPLGIVVPPGDTVNYPTEILARVADLIVVRLDGEHGPGTAPGAPVTADFVRRELGLRSVGVGASRLVAEFPLYGCIWTRDGAARPITFADASALVTSEAGNFRRDPTSQFLTASGRDGWTVWVPDQATIQTLIDAAHTRGVDRIALSGTEGADPATMAPRAFTR
ncbi:MAG TPA: hypothetical protein VKO87_02715 [Gemmatimonadaceae bacterium]|nr:hypothetical protein [Gemmatimonadaceae bacterium]